MIAIGSDHGGYNTQNTVWQEKKVKFRNKIFISMSKTIL